LMEDASTYSDRSDQRMPPGNSPRREYGIERRKASEEMVNTVAYCGLICSLCRNGEKGCNGCRGGGGDGNCYQRRCCLEKGVDGCWHCEAFPCDKGYFADEEWEGLCRGFVQCIKDKGVEKFANLVQSKLGERIEYGDFRFKKEQEIAGILYGPGE